MALDFGSAAADAGMSKSIFDEMDRQLSPPLQKMVDEAADDAAKAQAQSSLDAARAGWQKLAYCIAKGVVEHLRSNMEIRGIRSEGTLTATVTGTVEGKPITGGTATGSFDATQSGTTTGHVN